MSDFDALPAAISVPKGRTAPRLELRLTPFAASCDLPSRRFGDRIYVVTPDSRLFIKGVGTPHDIGRSSAGWPPTDDRSATRNYNSTPDAL